MILLNSFHIYLMHMQKPIHNKRYSRTEGLFETPFKKVQVNNDNYLKHLVFDVHNNPVHHSFVENIVDYPWISYNDLISKKNKKNKPGRNDGLV